jgi:hypothetical protein
VRREGPGRPGVAAPLVGTLVADVPFDAFAVRGDAADCRRLLWSLGDWELDAQVIPANGASDVLAQIVPVAPAAAPTCGGAVRARRGGRAVAEARVLADGRFTFRGLRPGPYVFEGEIGEQPFVLPVVVVG